MGCGGSDVVRNTKTVWGDKTGNLGNFIPFFQGRVADVKTLKVDALLDELRDVAGFEVRIRYSFDGLFWDGDETLRAEDTPVGGWYYGTAFHQVLRNWQYWQVGFLIEDEGGASVGTARVELRLTKSSTMDLVLGTRADNQIARWDGESGLQGSSITIDDSGNLVLNSGDQIQFGGTTTNIDGLNSGDLVASAGGHIVLNAGTNHDVAIAENDSWWTRFSSAQYTFGLATNGSPLSIAGSRSIQMQVHGTASGKYDAAGVGCFPGDSLPGVAMWSYTHDSSYLLFDAYYDNGWKSADGGSNFCIGKNVDELRFMFDSGVATTGAISWNTAMTLNTSGTLTIDKGSTTGQCVVLRKTTGGTGVADNIMFIENTTTDNTSSRMLSLQWGGIATPSYGCWYIAFRDSGGTAQGKVSGNSAGGVSYVTTSDRRTKRNIQKARAVDGKGLACLRQILNCEWQHANNPAENAARGLGWIAQDLHAIFPEACVPPDPGLPEGHLDSLWGVEPMALIPLLIEGAQEQDAIVTAQADRIAALEAQVAALVARLPPPA